MSAVTESTGPTISTAAALLVIAVIALVVVVVVIASNYLGDTEADERARTDEYARRRLLNEIERHGRR